MELSDLERRALLGDQEAQAECTRLGILLLCWRCGGEAEVKQLNTGGKPVYAVSCKKHYCGAYGCAHPTVQKAIEYWNTRPAPPIGRCKDCAHSSPRMVMGNKTYGKVCKIDPYLVHEVNPDRYCDGFKPKEAPND